MHNWSFNLPSGRPLGKLRKKDEGRMKKGEERRKKEGGKGKREEGRSLCFISDFEDILLSNRS